MLVLAGKVVDLRHLRLCHLEGVNSAHAHATLVDVKHDLGRFLHAFAENTLKDKDDELHRRIVVVQKQNPIHRRLLRLGVRLGQNIPFGIFCARITALFWLIRHCHSPKSMRTNSQNMGLNPQFGKGVCEEMVHPKRFELLAF